MAKLHNGVGRDELLACRRPPPFLRKSKGDSLQECAVRAVTWYDQFFRQELEEDGQVRILWDGGVEEVSDVRPDQVMNMPTPE